MELTEAHNVISKLDREAAQPVFAQVCHGKSGREGRVRPVSVGVRDRKDRPRRSARQDAVTKVKRGGTAVDVQKL